MIDHIGIQVADVVASRAFYENLLLPLGLRPLLEFDVPAGPTAGAVVGFGNGTSMPFWLSPAAGPSDREAHVAFAAPDRATVDAFHAAALGGGVEVLHAPREFPEYHPGYYACFVRDPDGHNVEAVCHIPE